MLLYIAANPHTFTALALIVEKRAKAKKDRDERGEVPAFLPL
jgi:hypothetical protein